MVQSSYIVSNLQNLQWFCFSAHVIQILFVSSQDYCFWRAAHRLQKSHRSEQPHQSGKAFLRSRFLSHCTNYSTSLSQLCTAGFKDTETAYMHICEHTHAQTCINMHPCLTLTKQSECAVKNLTAFFCFSSEGKNIEHRENLQPPPKGEWNCGRSRQV